MTTKQIAESPLEQGAARVRSLREARAKLEGERPRLAALVQAAGVHSAEIESLQRARTEAKAVALIDASEADTGPLDERLAEVEAQARVALEAGTVAHSALRVLDERAAALAAELKAAEAMQLVNARCALGEQYHAAFTAFNEAVSQIREPLQLLMNIEAALHEIRDREAALNGSPNRWARGGYTDNLITALQERGLVEVIGASHDLRMPPWLRWSEMRAQSGFRKAFFEGTALD